MLREGAKINRSLLALANCINALVSMKKGLHIPYRDSKLTRLLKNSLEGTAVSVMIANISCASGQFDESRETLLYANRAKNIKITEGAAKRILSVKKNQQYQKMVNHLKMELRDMKMSLSNTINAAPSPHADEDYDDSFEGPIVVPVPGDDTQYPPSPGTPPPLLSPRSLSC
jgi:kinesin family protein 18/19